VPSVAALAEVQARWLGHRLHADIAIRVTLACRSRRPIV
jgi:hypothetical protein